MAAVDEALTILQIIALTLPAAAIFFQLLFRISESSPMSLVRKKQLVNMLVITLISFSISALLVLIVYATNSSNDLLILSIFFILFALATLFSASLVGYFLTNREVVEWIEAETGLDEFDENRMELKRIKRLQKILSTSIDELEGSVDETYELDELEGYNRETLWFLEGKFDFDVSSIETVGDVIRIHKDALEEAQDIADDLEVREREIVKQSDGLKEDLGVGGLRHRSNRLVMPAIRSMIQILTLRPHILIFSLIIFLLTVIFRTRLIDGWNIWYNIPLLLIASIIYAVIYKIR